VPSASGPTLCTPRHFSTLGTGIPGSNSENVFFAEGVQPFRKVSRSSTLCGSLSQTPRIWRRKRTAKRATKAPANSRRPPPGTRRGHSRTCRGAAGTLRGLCGDFCGPFPQTAMDGVAERVERAQKSQTYLARAKSGKSPWAVPAERTLLKSGTFPDFARAK
jgi:hypothetical protein